MPSYRHSPPRSGFGIVGTHGLLAAMQVSISVKMTTSLMIMMMMEYPLVKTAATASMTNLGPATVTGRLMRRSMRQAHLWTPAKLTGGFT